MERYALVPSFQWASTSTDASSFRRPAATSGRLALLVESDFSKEQPLANGSLKALSPMDRKWDAKLRAYVEFAGKHGIPRRKSKDAFERSLADWWRLQVDNFNADKLSEYRVERLVEEGLLVPKDPQLAFARQ